MRFVYDSLRHLVCDPFSVDGLHKMAAALGINRCWFHLGGGGRFPHYDIPLKKIAHVKAHCELVTPRELLQIIKKGYS